jgi:signal peptidase II
VQVSRRNPLDLRHPRRVFAAVAVTILIIDQVAKSFVRALFIEGESIHLVPSVLNLTYVRNVGAAFGLFPGRQPLFIATSCFVLFVIAAYWRRAHPREWPVVVALAMVSAGALGNLLDRLLLGQVTDFFEFAFAEFPVFNVADMAIICGVGLLAVWLLFPPQGEPASPDEPGAEQLVLDLEIDGPAGGSEPAGHLPTHPSAGPGVSA